MNLWKIGYSLHLSPDTLAALENSRFSELAWEEEYPAFLRNPQEFYDLAMKQKNPNLFALAAFLAWTPKLEAQYSRKNFPASSFQENLEDLRIWSEECLLLTGKPGIVEWDWVRKTFAMEVFRIGRLQYEPERSKEPILWENKIISAGTDILEVHIPKGEPLQEVALRASISQAISFFAYYFGTEYSILRCHSWLLARELQSLLPQNSGILQFQRLFTVCEEDYEYPQAEERVFGCVHQDPRSYPENTSLQKALKNWLCAGKSVGMGTGFIFL